jgi:hypothetical protein
LVIKYSACFDNFFSRVSLEEFFNFNFKPFFGSSACPQIQANGIECIVLLAIKLYRHPIKLLVATTHVSLSFAFKQNALMNNVAKSGRPKNFYNSLNTLILNPFASQRKRERGVVFLPRKLFDRNNKLSHDRKTLREKLFMRNSRQQQKFQKATFNNDI